MPTHEWACDLPQLSAQLGWPVTPEELAAVFGRLGGTVTASAPDAGSDAIIRLTWRPATGSRPPEAAAVAWLQAGDYEGALVLLEVLLAADPDSPELLYNLGMAHSDRGNLDRAVDLLGRLAASAPTVTNGLVALGVAEMRLGRSDEAVIHLRQALATDDFNPWAQRNLGAALLKLGQAMDALTHLRRATQLAPEDAQAWFGLAKASEATADLDAADAAYLKAIDLAGFDPMADAAREARSRIAQQVYRSRSQGSPRMDAVMYCLAAMERFDSMEPAAVVEVVTEIAFLGRAGLDVNDPAQQYQLRTLPGRFSGLQLVSMLFVGMKRLQPGTDVGFDLQQEYETAMGMHQASA
ncbi:MAG: tetratricopeptide repeat protein [Ardenticatenia bacterium]|nr:tetratricopeptide repeat protein [Ardenticatenia bacterium]